MHSWGTQHNGRLRTMAARNMANGRPCLAVTETRPARVAPAPTPHPCPRCSHGAPTPSRASQTQSHAPAQSPRARSRAAEQCPARPRLRAPPRLSLRRSAEAKHGAPAEASVVGRSRFNFLSGRDSFGCVFSTSKSATPPHARDYPRRPLSLQTASQPSGVLQTSANKNACPCLMYQKRPE